jgi:hypothetical protein
MPILMVLPSLFSAPIETALERDYFMTGLLLLPNSAGARLTDLNSRAAQQALDFGIVDGILERRPKFDVEST